MKAKGVIGTVLIIIGLLVILNLFVPTLDFLFESLPFHIIIGIILIALGFYIIKGYENKIEQRKDKT